MQRQHCIRQAAWNARNNTSLFLKPFLAWIFYVLYSTLLRLPPLRFHCVGGCSDWAWSVATLTLAVRLSKTRIDLIHHVTSPRPLRFVSFMAICWQIKLKKRDEASSFNHHLRPLVFNKAYPSILQVLLIVPLKTLRLAMYVYFKKYTAMFIDRLLLW